MAEAYKHIYKVDLNEQLKRFDVGDVLASGDEKANCFEVDVSRGGANVDLTGCAVYGYFIRPNDETMKVNGTADGNCARVELTKSCYVYDGAFSFAIKIVGNGITQTIAVFDGRIVRTTSENIVDGERVFYGLEDLLAQIAAMEAGTNNANTAAGNANTAASRANQAASSIENATASAETLATGQRATVSVTETENGKHFFFGLPRGEKGEKGDPGTIENVTITSINGLPEALDGKQPKGNYLASDGTAVNAEKLGSKAPEYYLQHETAFSAGMLLNSATDEAKGFGSACVLLYPNGLAEIRFLIKITASGSSTNNFSWGINRNLLISSKVSGADVPLIYPLEGGVCTYYNADGKIDASTSQYGGTLQATGEFWEPARIYTEEGSRGGWPSSKMSAGSYIEGVCFGTYMR